MWDGNIIYNNILGASKLRYNYQLANNSSTERIVLLKDVNTRCNMIDL